jgi:hypothetical protein
MEIMVVMPLISILSVTSLASTIQADLSLFLATNCRGLFFWYVNIQHVIEEIQVTSHRSRRNLKPLPRSSNKKEQAMHMTQQEQ